MADKIRLDKYLVEMGIGSRSQIKEAAKKGRILVDGTVEKKTERKIDPDIECVTFDGKTISYIKTEYYMLNKPQGVISATEDNLHRTVLDLIDSKQRKDLFPVGRLDIDTEGLLLITNDGELAHRLLSPKHHVDKQYYALVEGRLPEDAKEQFAKGIQLKDGTPVRPAKLNVLADEERILSEAGHIDGDLEHVIPVLLTIHEGKFHQVKRMFEAIDCKVVYLKRISMGNLTLDPELKLGEYRPLTPEEISRLRDESGFCWHVKRIE